MIYFIQVMNVLHLISVTRSYSEKWQKEELLRAMYDKKESFARYDPHLPLEGMVINEANYPISPKHIKR